VWWRRLDTACWPNIIGRYSRVNWVGEVALKGGWPLAVSRNRSGALARAADQLCPRMPRFSKEARHRIDCAWKLEVKLEVPSARMCLFRVHPALLQCSAVVQSVEIVVVHRLMLSTRDFCLLCPIVHPAQPFSPRVEFLHSQFTRVHEGGY
ncbi:unnamed protein product, partial [Ectocarpus sp. 8 AP-2014]